MIDSPLPHHLKQSGDFGAVIGDRVYYHESYTYAYDFALYFRGLLIDSSGKVLEDFETLPF